MIRWYKVKSSFFDAEFGVKRWKDIIAFMEKYRGFDIEVVAQYNEPFEGVDAEYKDDEFIKL